MDYNALFFFGSPEVDGAFADGTWLVLKKSSYVCAFFPLRSPTWESWIGAMKNEFSVWSIVLTNSFSRALLRFNDYVFRDERLASTAFLVFLVYTFTLFTTRLSTFPLLGFDAHASAVFTVLLACSIGLKFHSPIFKSARSVMLVFPVLVLAPLDSRRID